MLKRTSHASRLTLLLEQVQVGDLITHQHLTTLSKAKVRGSTSALSQARRVLRERGLEFETIWDTGIRRKS